MTYGLSYSVWHLIAKNKSILLMKTLDNTLYNIYDVYYT